MSCRTLPRSAAATMLAMLALLVVVLPAAAQNATITGDVRDAATGQPLPSAQVFLEGTGHHAIANDEGRYMMLNVPPGTHTVVVRVIGYADGRRANLRVAAGETVRADFNLSHTALRLQEVVVTGVTDPTEGVRVPFTVSRVTREDMPVPTRNAMQALQGRVAGARVVSGSGQPGSGVAVRLRARNSVNTSETPLMVVDGVVLTANILDLDPNDIESMEIVKGAAAASLYGARAASGVIQIQTRRGAEAALNQTRMSVRSEYGFNQVPSVPGTAQFHHFLQDASGNWLDLDGNVVSRENRVIAPDRIMDKPFTNQTYDHFNRFFDAGRFMNNTVTLSRNMESTNFYFSAADNREQGVVPQYNRGYDRQNFRLNLDHRLRPDFTLSWTSYYARSARENIVGSPFWNLRFVPADVDITVRDDDGDYVLRPDPTMLEVNPLYQLSTIESWNHRSRFMGAFTARYNPIQWLTVDGTVALDRSDRESWNYYPKGYKTVSPSALNDGQYQRSYNYDQSVTGHTQASAIRSFGDLTARGRVRYNFELDEAQGQLSRAREFRVVGVRNLAAGTNHHVEGTGIQVRSESVLGAVGLDYGGRYILDGLIRQDGSSLFGPDARWNTYYRVAASYRMAEESWWPFHSVTEFKPWVAQGTAGSRPNFSWRYETWSVGTTGPSKGQLGNRLLRPEHSTETEYGLSTIFFDRFSLEFVHARTVTRDQLIPIPLPGVFGYSSQYQNAGTVRARVYEANAEALLMNRPDFMWRMGAVWDRSNSTLHDWPRSCYVTGASNRPLFYRCEGNDFGHMYGRLWMTGHNQLPDVHAGSHGQFAINDDGYLVPVGNHSWQDGLRNNLWGTRVTIDGQTYDWGLPILVLDETGNPALEQIGDANPRFNMGFTNNLNWRGVQLFTLLDWRHGGHAYNHTRQWPYRDNFSLDQVQAGKPDEQKKPIDYYARLYNTNATNSHFVEPNGYVKLREVSLGFAVPQSFLQRALPGGLGVDNLRLELIGRNLATWTRYSGIDPEVGASGAGGEAENPTDSFAYPNFRIFTLGISIDF